MSRESFNKFCFTANINPSTEHLDIWKAACKYQRESDAKICEATPSEALAKHDAEVAAKALEDAAIRFDFDGVEDEYIGRMLRCKAEELRRKV